MVVQLLALWMHVALAQPNTASVQLQIQGVESTSGQMLVVLFNSPEGYPNHPEQAFRKAIVPVEMPVTTYTFTDLPLGVYAGFAVHDEDGNGEVDTRRIIPIPIEPIGATQGAKAMFGPHKFSDAKFSVNEGVNKQPITLIRM